MADHEEDVNFENTDAGSSTTYPMTAGSIRKGGFISMKGRPCKVVDVSTSKTGKHGHAKCNFVGQDIFTMKKYEEIVPGHANCDVPNITRKEYSLIDISEDGYVSLMTESGDTRDDLTLPSQTDEDVKLADQLKNDFEEGKELVVTVLGAMGEEKIISVKAAAP
eukprot:TRINITY_DN13639_c0_g1_i1.p3 TRINITY_DN13639_c0_g1~~TRINITY_DN13639_c0_g1_i1.p3  ORF type:complete len:164 (-),score=25.87 TRINITY_DN13639_c0_g1_i1:452-943(-)